MRDMLEITEMKMLKRISGKILLNQERSANIRRECNTENILFYFILGIITSCQFA